MWFIHPKGGAAELNRDSLWLILERHGWKPTANVAFNEVYSAVRARPMKPGETPRYA